MVLSFIDAFRESDKAKREADIASAVVAAYSMIEPFIPSKPGVARVKDIVAKYLPLIAGEFGA